MILKNQEKKENNRLAFTVESDNAEFEQAIKKAYQKNKGQISIPGFRRGKAPLAIIEGMYGREVFYQDALDELVQPAFDKGVEEGSVNFIGMPSIVSADVSDERTAVYTFSVELYPEVELGQYKGLEVEKVPVEVSEEEVDREIETVRKRNARKLSVEDRPAQKGDTANIDYEGFLDAEKTTPFEGGKGENHDLELGSGSFVPGFEDQVIGMGVGEEKDINITFPENYAKDLAGKDAQFDCTINGIYIKPEFTDEFVAENLSDRRNFPFAHVGTFAFVLQFCGVKTDVPHDAPSVSAETIAFRVPRRFLRRSVKFAVVGGKSRDRVASLFQVGNAVVCNLVPNFIVACFAVHSIEGDRIVARIGVIVPFHGRESHESCVHVHHRVHIACLRFVSHVVDELDGVALILFVFENPGGV